jgi:hypothetical protein
MTVIFRGGGAVQSSAMCSQWYKYLIHPLTRRCMKRNRSKGESDGRFSNACVESWRGCFRGTDRGENLTTYNPCFSSVYIK